MNPHVPEEMDKETFLASLDEAVNALLTIRVLVGGLEDHEVPQGAIDEVLRMDVELWRARLELDASVQRLRRLAGAEGDTVALDIEVGVNAITVRAVDLAYRIGVGSRLRLA